MRVSIINPNLVGQDAIGGIVLDQLQFFRRNGDVQVYTPHPIVGVDDDVAAAVRVVTAGDLIEQRAKHFYAGASGIAEETEGQTGNELQVRQRHPKVWLRDDLLKRLLAQII